MELFLNVLWLMVAAGLTGFLLRHQRTRASHLHWGSVLAATLFIAVLLFPAISASDDLYGELFFSEDTSRRSLSSVGAHLDLVPAADVLSASLFGPCLSGLGHAGFVVESGALMAIPFAALPASGLRAPPADLIS